MNSEDIHLVAELAIADGSRWGISADDRQAAELLKGVVDVMNLRWSDSPAPPVITMSAESTRQESLCPSCSLVERSAADIACSLVLTGNAVNDLIGMLRAVLGIVSRHVQARGGMLIHSALAEFAGRGVALAGRGGIGKTTASRRLPPPWHSLCDDAMMIVRDQSGAYWAHPLPTASQLSRHGSTGMCDFPRAVPLHALLFLSQSPDDRIEPLRGVTAVGRLLEVAMQAAGPAEDGQDADQVRRLRAHLFDNACALTKTVPSAILHLSLIGSFWLEMERTLSSKP